MKILFICGSIQPQRCGVGDYCRRLAGELIRQGHHAYIISLMDADVSTCVLETQHDGDTAITVFRLPYSNGYRRNCLEARSFLHDVNPDWVSLQYVPFSFQRKGLPLRLSKHIMHLTNERNLHIMFHELWVGMDKDASIKEYIWGRMQLKLILSLIGNLKPNIVSTQTSLYRYMLSKLGIQAQLLPLFSNIEVAISRSNNFTIESEQKRKADISFVLFGSVHKNAPLLQFARELKSYSVKVSRPIRLVILGRTGKEAQRWSDEFRRLDMTVISAGEQPVARISKILSDADFGISTSVFRMLEKSGSVAAMIGHGLNVICVATDFAPDSIPPNREMKGVFNYSEGNLEKFFEPGMDELLEPSFNSVSETSSKLTTLFEKYSGSSATFL